MKPRIGHHRNGLHESRRKAEKLESKRLQVGFTEDLLKTHEAMPNRDHEYELHLRAKLRQKKNELAAMGDDEMKLEDY